MRAILNRRRYTGQHRYGTAPGTDAQRIRWAA